VTRDREVVDALHADGWRVAIVWECGLRAAYLDETVVRVLAWVWSESGDFESDLVRPRAGSRV